MQQIYAVVHQPASPPRQIAGARPSAYDQDPAQMQLGALARRCAAESERFYRGQPHDTRFAFELFRRALVERSELAWEYLFTLYSPLVDAWVRRSGAFATTGESSEFFVGAAFVRFWRAITPERFATFPSLAALLQYLQRCATCVVIDSVRAQSWAEMLPEEAVPAEQVAPTTPDEEALARIARAELWRFIETQVRSEAERLVLLESFVLGMKPGDIYEQHPELFESVTEVYNVKRNVLGRLSRNQELRRMIAAF